MRFGPHDHWKSNAVQFSFSKISVSNAGLTLSKAKSPRALCMEQHEERRSRTSSRVRGWISMLRIMSKAARRVTAMSNT